MGTTINSAAVLRARHPAFSFPALFTSTLLTSQRLKDECGHNVSFIAFLLKDNKRHFMLGNNGDIEITRKRLLVRIIRDKYFIKGSCRAFDEASHMLLRFCRYELRPGILHNLSDNELYDRLVQYYKKYEVVGYHATKLIFFAPEMLLLEIRKHITEDDAKVLQPTKLSYYNRFEVDYSLACRKIAMRMSRRWGWIPFDYLGNDEWDADYFMRRMGIDYERINEIIENKKRIRLQQRKMFLNYHPRIIRLMRDYQHLSILQDEDKAVRNISHTYLQKYLFEEIASRIALEKKYLVIMTPLEIKAALLGKRNYDKNILEDRFKASAFVFKDGAMSVFQGKNNRSYQKIASLIAETNEMEVKGFTASPGKVSGIVKVCLTSKDIAKVQVGDILVAPMTTPDYSSAMKRAIGFITDEGGITSHAAVIAREMNIPCVIGTRNATKIFKDGDLIELDADNGIVRKVLVS